MRVEADTAGSGVEQYFGSGLRHHSQLPLRWTGGTVATGETRNIAEANLKVLQAVAQLDERAPVGDDADPQELELARLHAKVDLLIGAVGALVRQRFALPEPVAVQFSADKIAWQADAAPGEGRGSVALYLHPTLLQPLLLRVRLAGAGDGWVWGSLEGLSEAEHSALERFIFLQHRRLIAERRALTRR